MPATMRELSTVTIMRMTESMLPVCSSMMAEMAMAMRVQPPSAAPAPRTAYTVGCATLLVPTHALRFASRPKR